MRPIYEKSADISNEELVAEKLSKIWDFDNWKRNPPRYPIDISLMRDNHIKAFAEIKCRNVTSDTYNTYLLSSAKVMSAHTLTRATGLPCFLVVQWTDCLGWIDLETTEPLYVGWGGRIDRNDSQDMEPVMHYDILEFKRMEQKHESKII
tara:strand:+ start:4280 stop:4729 length:450 start_codon:yes stop_codon:yes gene_type:complete